MKFKSNPFHSVSASLAAAVLSLGGVAFAADYTWGGGDSTWTDTSATGWNGGYPVGGDTATINTGTVTATANNQQAGVFLTIGPGGVLNDGGNFFYFAGGSLTLDSGSINVSHIGNGTYRSGGLGATVTANSGTSSINNNGANLGLALDSGGTTFTGDGNLNISIGLDNYFGGVATGITKSGAGTVTLSGGNTYTGATTVNDGTLALAIGGTLATSSGLIVNGGTVSLQTDNSLGTAVTLNGGVMTMNNNWSVNLGAVTLNGGDLSSSGYASGGYGSYYLNSDINAGAGTSTISAVNITSGGVRTFTVADGGTLNVSGSFSNVYGSFGLTKAGNGTMTLSGGNTFTGVTTVNGGTLALAASGTLDSSSELIINNGGTVSLQSVNPMGSDTAGPVTINSGGLMTMNAGHSVNLGSLTLNGGELSSAGFYDGTYGSYYLRNDVTVGTGTSTISAEKITSGGVRSFDVAAGGTLNVTGNFSSLYGSFGLTKTGDGTMILAGSNDYTGATMVSAGTLLVTGALGNTAVSVDANATVGGSGTIGGTLSFAGDSLFDVFSAVFEANPIGVTGTVSFGSGFGIDNLTGINWDSVAPGTYTLIDSTQDFSLAGLDNWGSGNAVSVGTGGYTAYFQDGSLQLVVIPEPGAALLGSLGLLALLRRRR
ncbi:MAG: autotransporter-associated beta strand repeat-containing protein [Verrucomicrobiae bacterium]|nr:autotransporter-associated beta strand repeat-containing protein [Verrucomicrobiae bacterium]